MSSVLKGFDPIISKDSKILILGSFPGVISLEKQEYYAHPQNQFWSILFTLFNQEFSKDYSVRIQLIQNHGIGLWDVIDTCSRKGSLDADIQNEMQNDIKSILQNHPVKALFCNGQKSFKNLQRIMGTSCEIPIYLLPSTSPAYAAMKKQAKLEQWKMILNFVS